jgi:lysine 2,3-aminomutase
MSVSKFGVGATPIIRTKIKAGSKALQLQFEPSNHEQHVHSMEESDPISDEKYSPVKGIVHRHADRCLFMPVPFCAVYCRFCFRKDLIGPSVKGLSDQEIDVCLDYIRNTSSIWEVIFTGGDPLMLNNRKLNDILQALNSMDHVKIIRFHTRMPIVSPNRVNEGFLDALNLSKAVYILLHINHPDEFSPQAKKAIDDLLAARCSLLAQTVLLKGINDDVQVMTALNRLLIEHRIKPYYFHHLDRAKGTNHFRVPISKGQEIIDAMKPLSGLCQTNYILDLPGGYGKVRIEKPNIQVSQDGYQVRDHDGQQHFYQDVLY